MQSIIDFINQIETGNLVDAQATFQHMIDSALEAELEIAHKAVAQSVFGEEHLSELKDTTLRSYIDKVEASTKGIGEKTPAKKIWKRTKGVVKASNKLSK